MHRDRGATEQSSGIATSGIGVETDAEGLKDGKLLESRALGRWPGDLEKSSLEVSWISFGHGTKCNTCAGRLPELRTAELGPRAVVVLTVRSIAVSLESLIRRQIVCQVRSLVKSCAIMHKVLRG